jgi:imidazolonepropionase-like amidohydrolase
MILRIVTTALCLTALAASGTSAPQDRGLAIYAGKLLTMDDNDTVINHGVVLSRNGRIEAIGREGEIAVPEGYKVIDARKRWVIPGLVDYHSHIGGSLSDLNDGVYLTNPGLRVDECYKPDNPNIRDARAAGITTLLVIPGSGNNMAGFGIIYKSAGRTLEESALANPGCSKMAQAGNPERWWYGVGRSFMYWNLRTTLEQARDYHLAWCAYEEGKVKEKPERSLSFEPFRALFRGEIPTCMHTQAYQVCMSTFLMMHDYFGFWTVPTHSTFDAYRLAELAKDRGICIIAGPRNIFLDTQDRRINGVPAKWAEGGVTLLGTETDSPVLPIEEHPYQAALASRMGWEPYAALKGITMATARGGMVEDRVGSIEKGKDADFGIWTGDPLDPRSSCCMTLVNGKVIYDKKNGQRY